MNRSEAIKVPRTESVEIGGNAVSVTRWLMALDMAVKALEAVPDKDVGKNEPLTLDELRKMDGEPVWCEIYIKGQPSFYGIVHGETVTGFISGDDKPANLAITNVGAYGLAWLAYRQKPEEGTV